MEYIAIYQGLAIRKNSMMPNELKVSFRFFNRPVSSFFEARIFRKPMNTNKIRPGSHNPMGPFVKTAKAAAI